MDHRVRQNNNNSIVKSHISKFVRANVNASVTCKTRGKLPVCSNVPYMSCMYDSRFRNFALVHMYWLPVSLSYTRMYSFNKHTILDCQWQRTSQIDKHWHSYEISNTFTINIHDWPLIGRGLSLVPLEIPAYWKTLLASASLPPLHWHSEPEAVCW